MKVAPGAGAEKKSFRAAAGFPTTELAPKQLELLRACASLSYKGAYVGHVKSVLNITEIYVHSGWTQILNKLRVQDRFSAVSVSLENGTLSLKDVNHGDDLDGFLRELSSADRTFLADVHTYAAKNLASSPELLGTAMNCTPQLVKDSLSSIRTDLGLNEYQLAVVAYACKTR